MPPPTHALWVRYKHLISNSGGTKTIRLDSRTFSLKVLRRGHFFSAGSAEGIVYISRAVSRLLATPTRELISNGNNREMELRIGKTPKVAQGQKLCLTAM